MGVDVFLLLLKAAVVFAVCAEREADHTQELFRKSIDAANRGLGLSGSTQSDDLLASLRHAALLHLALDYHALGETARALEACRQAMRSRPHSADALLVLGLLSASMSGAGAQDLRIQVRSAVQTPVPCAPSTLGVA
jgi:hypothetical protein